MRPKTPPCEIWPVNESMEDEEFPGGLDYAEVQDRIYKLTKEAKIGIPLYEDAQYACFGKRGALMGVVTGGIAGEHAFQPDDGTPVYDYRFSVVVSPKAQRKGIARRLVKEIEEHARIEAEGEDYYIYLEAWVVNPHMADLLDSMGFEGASEWSLNDPMMGKYL